jgi:SSS family solute:Na+ symporter
MPVIEHASAAGKLEFFPNPTPGSMADLLGAWITMMLGSIPQQDVFQRITSARTARSRSGVRSSAPRLYFCFTFVPMFIAYSATLIDPATFNEPDPD